MSYEADEKDRTDIATALAVHREVVSRDIARVREAQEEQLEAFTEHKMQYVVLANNVQSMSGSVEKILRILTQDNGTPSLLTRVALAEAAITKNENVAETARANAAEARKATWQTWLTLAVALIALFGTIASAAMPLIHAAPK
jgi:predicted regulator of amino acid metabolism with ACT domain